MKKFRFLSTFIRFIQRENLHRIFFVLLVLIVMSTFALTLFEPGITLINAFWLSIVTLTTVGYGDITPATLGGRIVGVIIMLFGIGILGMFTASIASIFVEKKLKEDRGMISYNFKNHIIICSWNTNTRGIIQELRADPRTKNKNLILIANLDLKPLDDDNLFFIRGDANEENLLRANLAEAETIIILGDDTLEPGNRDANVVLTTLAVESLNPDIYSIVELEDAANVRHCERAKADEIILRSEFSSRLVSRSTLDHGITKVISTLLSSREGNDILKIPVPGDMADKAFIDVFTQMKLQKDAIILAVQKDADGQVVSNPPNDFIISENDRLLVVAKSERSSKLNNT